MYQCIHQMCVADINEMIILINYYNYGITKHYVVKYNSLMLFSILKIFFLESEIIVHSVLDRYISESKNVDSWQYFCHQYLKLLKEAING